MTDKDMTEPETRRPPSPRLLQMMLSKSPGGGDRFFEKLSGAFAGAGVPQLLVIEPNPEREKLLSTYPGARVETLRFGGLRELPARVRLRRLIREFRPEVALSWMSRASRRMPPGPFVKVARLGDYYPLKHYRRCDQLIANTPDILDYMRREGWPEDRCRLIGNFCDAPNFASRNTVRQEVRRETGVPADATVLLALGRLHPKKAHDVLFRAMVSVPGTYLLLAGEGPIRGELDNLAADLGLNDRIRFLGWRRDAERLFAAADICVMPSRFEPLGNVILEAWANRTPVIAARATGPEWLVEDNKSGLLFPIDNAEALASALQRLIGDPALAEALVGNGWQRFQQDFSQGAVVDRYLHFFQEAR